jgi:hypothetical protein
LVRIQITCTRYSELKTKIKIKNKKKDEEKEGRKRKKRNNNRANEPQSRHPLTRSEDPLN